MDYIIKDLTNAFEMEGLEDVQQRAWGYSDRDLTPGSLLTVHANLGGVVCAAFSVGSDVPVGFAYSFPAMYNNKLVQDSHARLVQHSHMLAIVPEHRASGLATRLKLHQRSRAMAMGYALMTWTFDPTLTKNARLNLGKLGAVAVSYFENWYALKGGIYAGLPADRFFVEWDLTKAIIERPKTAPMGNIALEADGQSAGIPNLEAVGTVLIESPRDIDWLKKNNLEAARTWRMAHRLVFAHYFALGYTVTDLHDTGERTFYRLEPALLET